MKNGVLKFAPLAIVVMASIIVVGSISSDAGASEAGEISVTIPVGEYEIEATPEGHELSVEGFGYLLVPGTPKLPSKTFVIAIPPGTEVVGIDYDGGGGISLPGVYSISATPLPRAIGRGDPFAYERDRRAYQEKMESVYRNDDAYPRSIGELLYTAGFREYNVVGVRITPFSYKPLSGQLAYCSEVTIHIRYAPVGDSSVDTSMHSLSRTGKMAREFIFNYDQAKNWYSPARTDKDIHDFVIITTDGLSGAITSSTFLAWKALLGYGVRIVSITDDEIATQPGSDLPQKIRNFLRTYHLDWGIEYVLIVGDHATIPMRYCYPDPTNHRFDIFDWTSGEVPTDYYYADLSASDSESWDLDGDGYYGEYGEDLPDFLAEVSVGRIPTNQLSRITYALNKLVTFEQDVGGWKNHALHAGAFYYFTNENSSGNPAMDGAVVSFYIEQDVMNDWTISHYSEQVGLEVSDYAWPALNETAFIDDWRTGQYAVVKWQGHGWTDGVARKVWSWDDGDGVPESNEISWPYFITMGSDLDDDYPSIVTAASCYVGCPESAPGGNLGIDLLTDPSYGASIGVVASARSPYGSSDWPTTPGGTESIIYEFNRRMIDESEKVGDALYDSKFYCNQNYGWDHYAEYIDMFTFNLFGDPSLVLEGISPENFAPERPAVSGIVLGATNTEYEYTATTTDPEGDDVAYWFDWGDGESSGWTEFVTSGLPGTAAHAWTESGSFSVTVRAKDVHDNESDWSDSLFVTITAEQFLRGDANADADVAMADAIFTLRSLYVPNSDSLPCLDAGDSDDNGAIEMADAIFTLRHLYVPDSPKPPPPGPDTCGIDPTPDDLGCVSHPCMGEISIETREMRSAE